MEIIIVSDSHGNVECLKEIVRLHPQANYFFHLGDSERYPQEILPFISVQGNCDYYDTFPLFRMIKTKHGIFYLEHGHRSSHSNNYILNKKVDYYLYGHTHILEIKKVGNTYVINPGSISYPRDSHRGSYIVMKWDQDGNPIITPHFL